MRKRNIKISIRMSEEEKKELEKLSKECGYGQAGYLISLFRGKKPKPLPVIDYYHFINQLKAIGNNLNQIAVKANTIGFIDVKKYDEETSKLNKVIKEIEEKMQLPENIERIEKHGNN